MELSRTGIAGLSLGTVAALAGSFALGASWGGTDDGGERAKSKAPRTVAAGRLPIPTTRTFPEGSLRPAGSCAELRSWYVENALPRVTAWGWDSYGWRDDLVSLQGGGPVAGAAELDRAAAYKSQSSSPTGTNVQESGVDEPDVVKTNGELLVRVEGDDLTTYDVTGARPERLSTFDLPGSPDRYSDAAAELLLVDNTAFVVSQRWTHGDDTSSGKLGRWGGYGAMSTVVHTVDLSEPDDPELVTEETYAASLLSARLYGDTLRVVLGKEMPDLDFVMPGEHRTKREALQANRTKVRESTIEDWLPTVRRGDAEPALAVGCDAMVRTEDFAGLGNVSVIGWSSSDDKDRSAMGVAAQSSTVYSSTDRLYLATSAGWDCCIAWGDVRREGVEEGVTELHAFALEGTTATYVGSGEVEGRVRDRWSMDAVDGTLRVAVGATSQTGNFNSVVTLREEDDRLVETGRVDRLGVNEEIKSVRWFDDLAIVVTFRQTDPLYAIDLSDPARPRKLGELKIPGFSEYLHPIGRDRLLGIGQDATLRGELRGGQAAVFDISDLRRPRQLDKHLYRRDRHTTAGEDPRQFTWLDDRQTALTVVRSWGEAGGATAWISVLEVGRDGTLSQRLLRGAYGYDDVAKLRTVPLPDGRVVAVTEDDARFLRL